MLIAAYNGIKAKENEKNKIINNYLLFLTFLIGIKFIQVTQAQILDGISTEILVHPYNMQLQINWDSKIINDSKIDLTVTPISKNCHQGVCIEDGLNTSFEKIILPRHAISVSNVKPECSIDPGCEYYIKIETQNRKQIKNITFSVPDCSTLMYTVCSCRIQYLPELSVSGKLLENENAINISWKLDISEKFFLLNSTNLQIVTTIFNKTNPSLSWGGLLKSLGTYNTPIQLLANNSYNINYSHQKPIKYYGYKIHSISTISESHYLIESSIIDGKGCTGSKKKFTIIVPTIDDIKNSSKLLSSASVYIKNNLFTIIIFGCILILIVISITNYIYKNIKNKQNTSSNWRSVYRNVSSGEIHPMPMEENLIYLDKDILDAQMNGKADIFEIPHNAITISHEIGKGAFGRVFKATVQNLHRQLGTTEVAIKQLKKKPSTTEIEEFLNEIQTMKNVGYHENIVTLLGCCTIKEPYMMIMEYIGQSDLLQYLRNIRKRHFDLTTPEILQNSQRIKSANTNSSSQAPVGKYLELKVSLNSVTSDKLSYTDMNQNLPQRPSLTETTYTILSRQTNSSSPHNSIKNTLDYFLDNKELHNFAIQIANGMKHLEEKGITHRDLAARNVLIDNHKILKISDFGLSRPGIYVKPKDKVKLLPLRWLSTEAIHDNFYSSKSDVWAYGIVLWEIGTLGGFPYPTLNNNELLQFIFSGKRLEKPDICTDFLYKLMLKCWDAEPDKRPSFAEILNLLQSQNTKVYINFDEIGQDYVFSPIEKETN